MTGPNDCFDNVPLAGPEPVESIFGADDRIAVSDATAFPYRAIGRVSVGAEAGVFQATGFLVSPYHVLTAGHAVSNDAYGGDGLADTLTIAFAQEGDLRPFGTAEMVHLRVAEDWLTGRVPGADWALVTLDRSIGEITGWFGLEAQDGPGFYDGLNVQIAGYPGDKGGETLWTAAGPATTATDDRLLYAGTLDSAGGMSGSPVWRSFSASGERRAAGIHTTGASDPTAPGATNGATRITVARKALIEEWISQDALLRAPQDRPDLVDGATADPALVATVSTTETAAGRMLGLTIPVRNLGTAPAPAAELTVYASLNATITTGDLALATAVIPALEPFETATLALEVPLPTTLPAADYRLGWILDPAGAVAEFDEANNTGLLAESVTVVALPDFAPTLAGVSTRSPWPGAPLTVTWSVANGGAAAGTAPVGLYLSTDATIEATDFLLVWQPPLALAPGAGATLDTTVTLPAGLSPGSYWLGALADPLEDLAETAEANATAPLALRVPGPGALTGSDDRDTIIGTAGDDEIHTLGFNDKVGGLDGRDRIYGGPGNDRLDGGEGDDTLAGGDGVDTLLGKGGNDLLFADWEDDRSDPFGDLLNAGPGDDTVIGAGNNDIVYGDTGRDLIFGRDGNDILFGNADGDTIHGGPGRDRLLGEGGDDSLLGGEGNDLFGGGDGGDTFEGGAGDDFIDAEAGDDLAYGGDGIDTILLRTGNDTAFGGNDTDILQGWEGDDSLFGGDGRDRLYGMTGRDWIDAGPGDDLAFGNEDDDTVFGGPGADFVIGEGGDDSLSGGDGDDVVGGRDGADTLSGDAGNDLVDGEAGDDVVDGGVGDDRVFGRDGADTLAGGEGDDTLTAGAGDDELRGGPGADRLAGEAGADRFFFAVGDGGILAGDLIFDFVPGEDKLVLSGGVTRFEDLTFASDGEGRLTLGYGGAPEDAIALQGVTLAALSAADIVFA